MLQQVARAIRGVSLGVWLGGGVMTFITAHYVFNGGFLTKTAAGDVMGAILHAGGWLKMGLAALALGSYLIPNSDGSTKVRKPALIALIVATLLAAVVVFYLEPAMVELRAQFRNDPNPDANPARAAFGKMHGGSMGMALLELILIAFALICALI